MRLARAAAGIRWLPDTPPQPWGAKRSIGETLLRREREQLFDSVSGSTGEASARGGNIVAPRMDISEDDQAFRVTDGQTSEKHH